MIGKGCCTARVVEFLYVSSVWELPTLEKNGLITRPDTGSAPHTSQPTLLVHYLESYLSDLEWWLRVWTIVINVSKSIVMLFAHADRHILTPRPVQLCGEPIHWVDTTRYLGVADLVNSYCSVEK